MIRKDKLIILTYAPWLLSILFQFEETLSFLTAWTGSFYIFYLTIFSSLAPLRANENSQPMVMRPIVLIQLIFAGFMCCTSIFYFIDHFNEEITIIAQCQRLSLLAHASLVSGMVLMTRSKDYTDIQISNPKLAIVLAICIITFLTGKVFDYIPPALIQFKYPLMALSITSGVYVLVKGLSERAISYVIAGSVTFSLNFIDATLTGFKEGIIIQILTLAFVSFHYYPKLVSLSAVPCFVVALYILPTYTTVIRAQSWAKGRSRESARLQAYETFFVEGADDLIIQNNWEFLTNRFSEIGMFVRYVKHTPEHQDFTGWEIISNSINAVIPRIIWEDKPSTETLAMRRVYDAGVAGRSSPVSAKTRPVVDGYLMGGGIGIFLLMISYGIITQILSNIAERLFGGYELGTVIIFNGLFQQLWRGNAMEFLVNNILYALALMLIIYAAMNAARLLPSTPKNEDHTDQPGL